VPHRVVALIGVDDDIFPRTSGTDGDDVLARDPCLGERDARSEDRQLLLDPVTAATDHLVVCYTGADPVTGAARPPAAPLAELIDTVKATVTEPDTVVTRQPLQPFDPANFVPPVPFSFDGHGFAGARAARHAAPPARFLPVPLPAPALGDVALDELVAFLSNPARAFLVQRLGVTLSGPADEIDDALPLTVDGLARWDIGARMVSAALSGAALPDLCQAELRRGTLPAGRLGTSAVQGIARSVGVVRDAAASYLAEDASTIDVSVDLGNGRLLTGAVAGVRGKVLLAASYSALSARQRLAAWARLLALAATTGDADWQAVTIGPVRAEAPTARRSTLTVPAGPRTILAQLVDVYDRGMVEPLPLAPATSKRYAARRCAGTAIEEARADAAKTWTGTTFPGDNGDDAVRLVHGTNLPFERLWDIAPLADEDWAPETSRFALLARRVWDPLLGAEVVGPA
jgi:exodeoxyribonuclease V gamma subunit